MSRDPSASRADAVGVVATALVFAVIAILVDLKYGPFFIRDSWLDCTLLAGFAAILGDYVARMWWLQKKKDEKTLSKRTLDSMAQFQVRLVGYCIAGYLVFKLLSPAISGGKALILGLTITLGLVRLDLRNIFATIIDIGGLINDLDSDDDNQCASVAADLKKMGTAAVPELLRVLQDKNRNWRLRKNVALVLGQMSALEAEVPLIECLHDENRNVQQGACWGLEGLKSAKAVDPLIDLLAGSSGQSLFTRGTAMSALLKITLPDPPVKVLDAVIRLLEKIALWQQELVEGRVPDELRPQADNASNMLSRCFGARDDEEMNDETLAEMIRQDMGQFVSQVMLVAFERLGTRARAPLSRLLEEKGRNFYIAHYAGLGLAQIPNAFVDTVISVAEQNKPEMVSTLLGAGSGPIRQTGTNGKTLLQWARETGNAQVERDLLERGVRE